MMFSIQIDHREFRKMAGEFFRIGENATLEELGNGFKALTLAYLGLPRPTAVQEVEQVAIMSLAGKRVLRSQFETESKE